jgi:UDP-N-acetylmuramyl pentapeptide phosphotransferase/UDP-N-acetylglucosamine-1-phosphate transferase
MGHGQAIVELRGSLIRMLPWLVLYFAIGVIGTWLARRYALHRELLDHPGERRSHETPTPRGGGISIVIALLVASCVLGWRQPQQIVLIAAFTIGLLLVAGIGLLDDHRPLSPWLRLAVQGVAAGVFALGVAGTSGNLFLALVAFATVMVLTNVWNFMDGINGIAASQAALVAAGLSVVAGGIWSWLALALVAACAGFLPFNFPRARIFLGDVGSGSLGFALAALLVIAFARHQGSWLLWLLPLSAFLVDSGLTLLRRIGRRERWWAPHTQHAYQRWAVRVGTHTTVTLAYAGWTILGLLLAGWLWSATAMQVTGFGLAWLAITVVIWVRLQYSRSPEPGERHGKMEKDRE